MAIQSRPTHILYQCAKFGDDRTSFNVICEVCDVYHVKGLYPYFDISVFYVSAVSTDIDLKFIQDTCRVVIISASFIGQRSRSQGRYIAF